jgi:integrase
MYANVNGTIKYYSLSHSVPEKAWNPDKQEVSTSFSKWKTINNDISRFRAKADNIRIMADLNDEKISLFEFDRIFRNGAKDLNDVFSFFEEDLKQFANSYANSTKAMYKSQSKKLKSFKDKLNFNELTPFFWKQYDSYLIGKGNNDNTRWKAFRTLKTFIRKAIDCGILKGDPLHGISVRKPEGNRQFLSIDELQLLEKRYQGFMTKDLKNVLQYFMFSCYTGLRYSDVKGLRFNNLFLDNDKPYLQIKQKKTEVPLSLPLGKKAMNYLPKQGLPNQTVFKVYTNQATNRALKKIMKLTKIEKQISFHCARHTFATVLLELSGDIATVSKLCGHTKISTTQIYAKVLEGSKRNVIGLLDAI